MGNYSYIPAIAGVVASCPCLRGTTGIGHFQVGLFLLFPLRGGLIRGKVGRLSHRDQLVGSIGSLGMGRLHPRRLSGMRRQGHGYYATKGGRIQLFLIGRVRYGFYVLSRYLGATIYQRVTEVGLFAFRGASHVFFIRNRPGTVFVLPGEL